jgi:signal transduction histidine kinase
MSDRRLRLISWLLFASFGAAFTAATTLGALNHSPLWSGENVQIIAFVGMAVVGLLVTLRRPRNAIGWIFSALGAWIGLMALAQEYSRYTLLTHRGALSGGVYAAWFYQWAWVPWFLSLLTFPFLLFPNGRLPSRRWRPVLWISAVVGAVGWIPLALEPELVDVKVANPFGLQNAGDTLDLVFGAVFALIPILGLAAAASLVVRFRRASAVERQQIKWFTFAGAMIVVGVGAAAILEAFGVLLPEILFNVLLTFLPASIGIAILRHRLFDIDVVINKTLVYGLLAAFITAVYVGIVVGIGTAVGSKRNLGLSILATALVAVGFQPVRERVQRLANRLVYGRRATPYEVLSEFSGGMAHAVATEELLPRMARIVAEGTGAAHVDVWLRLGSELVREVSWPESKDTRASVAPVVLDDRVTIPGADGAVAVRHQGELLGVIGVTKSAGETLTSAESKLLNDLASQAGLVLRNVRLIEELRTSRQRLVRAQDEERRRLERNLHDGAQQRLVSIALVLRMARHHLGETGDPKVGQTIDQAAEQLALALQELRELARGIHPAILTERGLAPALQSLAERSVVPATLESTLDTRLPPAVEATAYFVVSEALANVGKYSKATAVTVRAEQSDGELIVEVFDDGVGGADASRGSGLRGLADRVAAVDGRLEIVSPPAEGTRLTSRIPLHVRGEAIAGAEDSDWPIPGEVDKASGVVSVVAGAESPGEGGP